MTLVHTFLDTSPVPYTVRVWIASVLVTGESPGAYRMHQMHMYRYVYRKHQTFIHQYDIEITTSKEGAGSLRGGFSPL